MPRNAIKIIIKIIIILLASHDNKMNDIYSDKIYMRRKIALTEHFWSAVTACLSANVCIMLANICMMALPL